MLQMTRNLFTRESKICILYLNVWLFLLISCGQWNKKFWDFVVWMQWKCSQVAADIATSLNHTKKIAWEFQVQIAIFAEKVERAARWRQCWPCPLIWPDSYINWAPGSLASTGICSREDPLWKALCISGDCPYKFGALHPSVIYVHYTAHQAFWTPEIHKYDHKQVCHHLSSQAFSPPSIPPNRQCPNRKGVFFIMGFP